MLLRTPVAGTSSFKAAVRQGPESFGVRPDGGAGPVKSAPGFERLGFRAWPGTLAGGRIGRKVRMFNVELSIGINDGHTVAAMCGELDLADAQAVSSLLVAAAAACGPSIILDLTGLEFIDCCGLRGLLRVLRFTRHNGGDIYLAGPQQRVRKVLKATGLIDVFSVSPSVAEAVIAAKLAQPEPAVAL